MRIKQRWWSAFLLAIVLGMASAGAVQSQSSTTMSVSTRNFEVVSVDGNNLVVRDEKGARELTVPDDFRFTVDGKKMSVKELKPGMKGTATVTTTTKESPVTLTEVKNGTVVRASEHALYVRTPEGTKWFTQSQLDDRGVQILKDGRVIRIRDMQPGDQITATIVSKAPPVLMTEKEVQATLAQPDPAPAAAPAAAPAPAQAAATAPAPAPMQTAAATQPATAAPASPAPAMAAPQPAPAGEGSPWFWYIVIAVVLGLLWFFVFRKKEKT